MGGGDSEEKKIILCEGELIIITVTMIIGSIY